MDGKQVFRVVVAHPSPDIQQRIADALDGSGRFRVMGSTADGADCITLAARHKPDLLVTDTVLTTVDGLNVLQWMHSYLPDTRTLVLTSYGNTIADRAAALGADYCLLAPFTVEKVMEWATLLVLPSKNISNHFSVEDIEQATRHVLHQLGVSPKLLGFSDAVAGVRILIQDPDQIHYVTDQLYPAIGVCRNANWQSVERALRTVMDNIWSKSKLDMVEQYFYKYSGHYTSNKPTCSVFLYLLADMVTDRLRKAEAEKVKELADRELNSFSS